MKQKDLFVALSFTIFAIGLGMVIKETSYTVNAEESAGLAIMEPAAGDETQTTSTSNTVQQESPTPYEPVPSVTPATAPTINNITSVPETNFQLHVNVEGATTLRSIGSEKAPIVIQNFSAFACAHCANFHLKTLPFLRKEYIDSGKVRIIFSPFPINEPSFHGAMLAQCVSPARYERITELLYSNQTRWAHSRNSRAELFNLVRFTGISENFYNECLDNKEIKEFLEASIRTGSENYGITGTPTFVINNGDYNIRGDVSYKKFKEKLDAILSGQAK